MKKNKIKNLIIDTLIYLAIILAIVGLVKLGNHLGKENDKAFEKCLETTSYNRCAKSIYGVYP